MILQVCTMWTVMAREHQENASVLDQDQSSPTESWMQVTDMILLTRRLMTWAGESYLFINSIAAMHLSIFLTGELSTTPPSVTQPLEEWSESTT